MVATFTRRRGAIMTADTIPGYIAVIKCCSGPAAGVMTVIAGIAAGDMVGRFARGCGAVVTGCTTAQHITVVHPRHRRPTAGPVTILTGIGG